MMDYNFLSSVDRITSTYLNAKPMSDIADNLGSGDELKKQFGEKFAEAYDSLQAMKMLNATVHQENALTQKDSLREHASRLGYSIDNRVIDMLRISISDDMNLKVNNAMHSAANSLF